MVQIDNVKMWESLIEGNSVTYEKGMIERGDLAMRIINALKDQGLEYKDGEIVSKEEIKGNQREVSPNPSELTEFEKAIALLIFNSQETCNLNLAVCEKQARKESKALLTFARKQIASEQPVAWSEKDEKIRNALIEYLGGSDALSVDLALAISWLKSLRPQSHWKPSEEQMRVLALSFGGIYNDEDIKILRTLFEDLKAL